MPPRVSVLMSVHNGLRFLPEALDSILSQGFSDFEFIIVDDTSSDGSLALLEQYAARDARIRLVSNEKNLGLTASLNRGVELARGEYVARMDADDISLPGRFEKQVAFLDAHPEAWALGGQIQFIDESGTVRPAHVYPTDSFHLGWNMLLNGPTLSHPAAMLRRDRLAQAGNYPHECRLAQDAALWRRFLILSDRSLANLSDPVLLYRLHPGSQSALSRSGQVETVVLYQKLLFEHLLGREVDLHLAAIINFPSRTRFSSGQARAALALLLELVGKFRSRLPIQARGARWMNVDLSQRILSIAYRYPLQLSRFVARSLVLHPPVMRNYLQVYLGWLGGRSGFTCLAGPL